MPPRRRKNLEVRTREYLTPQEVTRLQSAAAKLGRYGKRDALMIRIAYVHGLRASELCRLEWSDIIEYRSLDVRRLKGSIDACHPLTGDVTRALKRLPGEHSGLIFQTERGTPLSVNGLGKIIARAGVEARIGFPVHPHMLRHACGYNLAAKGTDTRAIQGYLGHASIQNTVRYTAMSPNRFKGLWTD